MTLTVGKLKEILADAPDQNAPVVWVDQQGHSDVVSGGYQAVSLVDGEDFYEPYDIEDVRKYPEDHEDRIVNAVLHGTEPLHPVFVLY